MGRDPNKDIKRRVAMRSQKWNEAWKKHLGFEPSDKPDLAFGLVTWRLLETIDPKWREKDITVSPKTVMTAAEVDNLWKIMKFQKFALAFEQQFKKALLLGGEEGRRFARQLSEVFSKGMDQSFSWKPHCLPGEILLAWKEVSHRHAKQYLKGTRTRGHGYAPPTKEEIEDLIGPDRYSKQQWRRAWKDPFIAALSACP